MSYNFASISFSDLMITNLQDEVYQVVTIDHFFYVLLLCRRAATGPRACSGPLHFDWNESRQRKIAGRSLSASSEKF